MCSQSAVTVLNVPTRKRITFVLRRIWVLVNLKNIMLFVAVHKMKQNIAKRILNRQLIVLMHMRNHLISGIHNVLELHQKDVLVNNT